MGAHDLAETGGALIRQGQSVGCSSAGGWECEFGKGEKVQQDSGLLRERDNPEAYSVRGGGVAGGGQGKRKGRIKRNGM